MSFRIPCILYCRNLQKSWVCIIIFMSFSLVVIFKTVTRIHVITKQSINISPFEITSMFINISNGTLTRKQLGIPLKLQKESIHSNCNETLKYERNYGHPHNRSSTNVYIGICNTGRLGNRLFQFASAYGISKRVNRILAVAKSDRLLKLFQISNVVIFDKEYTIKKWKLVKEHKCCIYDQTVLSRLKHEENYRVGFYLQSWKYFDRVASEVRRQLTFQPHIQKRAAKIMKDIAEKHECSECVDKDDQTVFIGVHIRRGDMVLVQHFVDFGYATAPANFLYRAIYYYLKRFKHPVFVVCSDDILWAKSVLGNKLNLIIEFVHNRSIVDLAVLASCNHSIVTVGTFGWWAAYLAGGDVIYYKHPAKNGSDLQKQYSHTMNDFFPLHWIPLE